ncbi:hypothetical protein BC834DRAFT_867825 [Gloeopeniophorella convolvens]|nr:hypothetical protein BC834DRAFT_867825 [Gloeopeniophorella convolvens]
MSMLLAPSGATEVIRPCHLSPDPMSVCGTPRSADLTQPRQWQGALPFSTVASSNKADTPLVRTLHAQGYVELRDGWAEVSLLGMMPGMIRQRFQIRQDLAGHGRAWSGEIGAPVVDFCTLLFKACASPRYRVATFFPSTLCPFFKTHPPSSFRGL